MEEELKFLLDMNKKLEQDEFFVDNNSNIDLSTEYPYLVFMRDDLIRAINLCGRLIQTKSNISAYNSISFMPLTWEKKMWLYATNELSYFRFGVELMGDSNEMLGEDFSIPLLTLQKLLKLMGTKVLIYKRDSNFYIRLLGGDLLLDTRPISPQIIKFPAEPTNKIADLTLQDFGSIVCSMLPLLNSEIKGDLKKIQFTGNKAYFNSSYYYIESDISTPRLSLSYRDAEFISSLYKYYKDKQIQLFQTTGDLPRIYLSLDNINYLFINSTSSIVDLISQQMEKVLNNTEVVTLYDMFNKITNLATSLPGSTGNITLKYVDGILYMTIISNKGNSEFSFTTDKIGKERLYSKEVTLRAETLRKLLSSFNNSEVIGLALGDFGITLEDKGIKAVLMSFSN